MQSQFLAAINQICDEKNIPKDKVVETIKAALRAAYRKDYGNREQNIEVELNDYMDAYHKYFETFSTDEICLNPAPNYAVIKNVGVVLFGKNEKECSVMNDIVEHTMMAVLRADKLGGYESISLKDSFAMEYWELEQAKLKK